MLDCHQNITDHTAAHACISSGEAASRFLRFVGEEIAEQSAALNAVALDEFISLDETGPMPPWARAVAARLLLLQRFQFAARTVPFILDARSRSHPYFDVRFDALRTLITRPVATEARRLWLRHGEKVRVLVTSDAVVAVGPRSRRDYRAMPVPLAEPIRLLQRSGFWPSAMAPAGDLLSAALLRAFIELDDVAALRRVR